MFDTLSDRLGSVFDRLRGRGALSEADVRAAMREVRVALLEADVALPVARDFVDQVTEKAVGQDVLRSVTPGQMVVKIVHDALVETLGSETAELNVAVKDRDLARRFLEDFEQDLRVSSRLELARWRQRSLLEKSREKFWSYFGEIF